MRDSVPQAAHSSKQGAAGNRVTVQQRRVGLRLEQMVGAKVDELEEDRGVLSWES
ncbi:uncharacterized protein TrAtP1_003494 [Trichoderma atroviride]|uniref:uncharacterized protein n=1 Tax=Hypocrea atroviridis TaxID=63577 RepID=UPI00331688C8|nr:hypothetical protein TrAtP1_003494 [Trichoderma atroviride]